MSITDCKRVMKEYVCEIEGLKERIKDLEHAIEVKDKYIKKLEADYKELEDEFYSLIRS